MRLTAEFTTEPFAGEDEPPAHATAALGAVREAGLECDFGPFGTSTAGDEAHVEAALLAMLRAAFANGATRVTVQVERSDG